MPLNIDMHSFLGKLQKNDKNVDSRITHQYMEEEGSISVYTFNKMFVYYWRLTKEGMQTN